MSYRSNAINDLVQSILLDESKDGEFDWEQIRRKVEETVAFHAVGVKAMEQGITQYLRRHSRSDYVNQVDVASALLGIEDKHDARMAIEHNCGGFKHLQKYVTVGYQFRVAWAKLELHDEIAYRSHGGWYLTEYGDPHLEAP